MRISSGSLHSNMISGRPKRCFSKPHCDGVLLGPQSWRKQRLGGVLKGDMSVFEPSCYRDLDAHMIG